MAQRMSTGLCTALFTSSFKTIFDGLAEVRIWAGTPPATADAAISGPTLLVTVKNAGASVNFAAAAVAGVLAKLASETWGGTNAATGVAAFYRLCLSADANALSTTAPRVQGTVGQGNADMNLGVISLVSGAPFAIQYFTQSFVPA